MRGSSLRRHTRRRWRNSIDQVCLCSCKYSDTLGAKRHVCFIQNLSSPSVVEISLSSHVPPGRALSRRGTARSWVLLKLSSTVHATMASLFLFRRRFCFWIYILASIPGNPMQVQSYRCEFRPPILLKHQSRTLTHYGRRKLKMSWNWSEAKLESIVVSHLTIQWASISGELFEIPLWRNPQRALTQGSAATSVRIFMARRSAKTVDVCMEDMAWLDLISFVYSVENLFRLGK